MCNLNALFVLIILASSSCSQPSDKKDPIDLRVDVGWTDTKAKPDQDNKGDAGEVFRPPAKAKVRIVTFNVRRYFDDQCDSGRCEADDFEHLFSTSEFEFRGKQLANALKTLDADIIILQELEKESCLNVIGDVLGFEHRAFGEVFFNASLDVGVLSKTEISDVRRYRDDTTLELSTGGTKKFARELLEVQTKIKGEKVIVFAAHFKSKANDNPAWRAAEAKAAKEIIVTRAKDNKNTLLVLGGDLNDSLDSPTLDNLTQSGDLIASSNEDSWTYQYRGKTQQIDHLIYADFDNIRLVSVEAARERSGGFSVSDHAALIANFEIR